MLSKLGDLYGWDLDAVYEPLSLTDFTTISPLQREYFETHYRHRKHKNVSFKLRRIPYTFSQTLSNFAHKRLKLSTCTARLRRIAICLDSICGQPRCVCLSLFVSLPLCLSVCLSVRLSCLCLLLNNKKCEYVEFCTEVSHEICNYPYHFRSKA